MDTPLNVIHIALSHRFWSHWPERFFDLVPLGFTPTRLRSLGLVAKTAPDGLFIAPADQGERRKDCPSDMCLTFAISPTSSRSINRSAIPEQSRRTEATLIDFDTRSAWVVDDMMATKYRPYGELAPLLLTQEPTQTEKAEIELLMRQLRSWKPALVLRIPVSLLQKTGTYSLEIASRQIVWRYQVIDQSGTVGPGDRIWVESAELDAAGTTFREPVTKSFGAAGLTAQEIRSNTVIPLSATVIRECRLMSERAEKRPRILIDNLPNPDGRDLVLISPDGPHASDMFVYI